MKVTIKDIATHLNISPTAVSLALNGRSGISESTRKMVLAAAKEMGYEKKSAAHSSISAPVIQLVKYNKNPEIHADAPYFLALAAGISSEAQAKGYSLQVSFFSPCDDIDEKLQALESSPCSGIILQATEMNESDLFRLRPISKPLVILDCYYDSCPYDCIVINNEQGAYLATKHLIDAGHTDIAFFYSSISLANFDERRIGFIRAVQETPATEHCVKNIVSLPPLLEAAYTAFREMLSSGYKPPQAIFAGNDYIAVACIRALTDSGYRLPEDVSIVGFDNLSISEMIRPALTSIDIPKTRIGALSVQRLHSLLEEGTLEKVKISLSTNLVIRESVNYSRSVESLGTANK